MKICVALAVLAAAAAPAQSAPAAPRPPSLAEDLADVATRVCYNVAAGRLRWDPAKLEEEKALFARLGLKAGIPTGVIDSFGPSVAATFNRAVLGSRSRGPSHVLLAAGGQAPGCRVTVAGAPGVVTALDAIVALQDARHGWTPAPHLSRKAGPIERHSFVRRADGGAVVLLDLLVALPAEGNFRMMAMVVPMPPELKLPDGF
jgi:hypothetical protein